jgi:hypothetical protein
MSGNFKKTPRVVAARYGRKALPLLTFPLLCVLCACNTSRGTYASGPWGQSGYLDPTASLYSNPWNKPLAPSLVEAGPAPQPMTRSLSPEPLEPIGAWASRDVSPPTADSRDIPESFEAAASVPRPAPVEAMESEPPVAGRFAAKQEPSAPPQMQGRSFTALTGQWTAQEGDRSCRLQLSSTPALDLYKASASGCSSDALQNVNSWAHRDRTIVLYARGRVVSRLTDDGGSFTGMLEGTKTQIRISR